MTDLKAELDKLSLSLLKQASGAPDSDTSVDIFKAVSNYYLGTQRTPDAKRKKKGEDDNVPTFGAILKKVNGKPTGAVS